MPPSVSERRRAIRREPHSDEPLSRLRLRTGRELTVINISSCGALVEGLTRLLPNTRTDLHIVTRHGRVLVRTRVVRALVWRLERDLVCYRTALAFDTPVDVELHLAVNEPGGAALNTSNGYVVPVEFPSNSSAPGTGYPHSDVDDRA